LIYDSGAAECTLKAVLKHASLTSLPAPASVLSHGFTLLPTAKVLRLLYCGEGLAREKMVE